MREIKFRAQYKYDGSWDYFSVPDDFSSSPVIAEDWQNWCESTGLKDKNGKEIYDQDILKVRHESIEIDPTHRAERKVHYSYLNVRVNQEPGSWICYHLNGKKEVDISDYYTHLLTACEQEVEVIGNIYENKELLSEKV